MKILNLVLVFGFACSALRAQDPAPVSSRAEEIEQEQLGKAQTLSPDVPDPAERRVRKVRKTAERILRGSPWHLQLGGLPVGAGIAAGPVGEWTNSTDRIQSKIWALGSIYRFYNVGAAVTLPRLTNQNLDLTFDVWHSDSPQLDYYGQGQDSLKSNRTDFRREDTQFGVNLAWPILRHVQPSCGIHQDLINVGPGTSRAVTSTDLKFDPNEAPGIHMESNFLYAGCTLPFDFRDNPGYPHKGSALFLQYRRAYAEDHSEFSFNRVSAAAEHYIPFFNEKRVIALHADTELSFHGPNQVVPFYLQPTLGGNNDLRGFRPWRFYDENSLLLNAEYRWEICTGFDMAIFEDVGKVFHRPGQIDFSNLRKSTGFGLRFNDVRSMILRVDTGFSREGFQVWVTFNKVFSY